MILMITLSFFIVSIQSLTDPFKTNQIFIHPSSMKTKNTPKGCFEYNFTGVQFQVYGTYNKHYSIYLDDEFHATVNYVPASTNEPQYTSEYLPFGRHTIKLLSSDEAFEISQVSYLPSSNVRRIDFEAFEASGTWRDWTPTGTSNHVKYTAKNGDFIRIQIRCSKFWVYGIEDPYHGDMTVKFNDFEATFSEKAETNYEYHVVYESPDLPLTDGTLTLTNSNSGSRSTSIAYVLILAEQFPCPASDPVPVSSGAMKAQHIENVIETDEFDCEHFDNPCGLFIEPKDTSLPCSIVYTFTGVRFQVFGTFAPGLGKYRVYLDGVELATISQEYITRQDFALQYTSDIFIYGQHTIRIAADAGQQFKIFKLTYTISLNAKLISIDEFKGGYKVSNVLGGFYYFKEGGEVFRSTVSCSKFWIVGDRYNDFKNLYVSYGENYPEKSFYQGGAGTKLFTILAESPELPLGSNELFISSEGPMIYHGIYIIEEPEIKAEPVSVSILRFDTLNSEHLCSDITTCPENEVASTACGRKCRTTGEATVTYDYKFIGVKFQIFGAIGSDLQTFDIYLDGKFYARFDERIGKQQSYAHLYTSELLEYGEHTIILQSDKVFEIYKLTYWVSMFAKRINFTDFQLSDGMIKESDFTGGIEIHSRTKPIYLKKHLCTSKFWIIGMGYKTPMSIKSGKFEATPTADTNHFCYMIYESPELSFYTDELTISTESDRLYFNCIYYIENCPPPTEVFSKSESFSLSTQFSSSMIFSQTNEFSPTGLFSYTKKFSESDFFSQSGKFSKSDIFLQTEKFSETGLFSQSAKFSGTLVFSEIIESSNSEVLTDNKEISASLSAADENSSPEITKFSSGEETSQNSSDETTDEISQQTANEFSTDDTTDISSSTSIISPEEDVNDFSTAEKSDASPPVENDSNSISISDSDNNKEPDFSSQKTYISESDDSPSSEKSPLDEISPPNEEKLSSGQEQPMLNISSLSSFDEFPLSKGESLYTKIKENSHEYEQDASLLDPSSPVFIEGGFFFKKSKKISLLILGILLGLIAFILLILIIVFIIIARKIKDEKNSETEKQSEVETISGNSENIKTEFENPLFENNFMQNDPFLHAMSEDEFSIIYV